MKTLNMTGLCQIKAASPHSKHMQSRDQNDNAYFLFCLRKMIKQRGGKGKDMDVTQEVTTHAPIHY